MELAGPLVRLFRVVYSECNWSCDGLWARELKVELDLIDETEGALVLGHGGAPEGATLSIECWAGCWKALVLDGSCVFLTLAFLGLEKFSTTCIASPIESDFLGKRGDVGLLRPVSVEYLSRSEEGCEKSEAAGVSADWVVSKDGAKGLSSGVGCGALVVGLVRR